MFKAYDYIPVSRFYTGKSVFVTGGTGFLGKVLVEKLLWSCPGVEYIYLLMRPKKNQDAARRLAELLNIPIFERLRNTRPSDLGKIIPVNGDLTKPLLGIDQLDQDILIREISVVFHVGATVRFNETFRESVLVNTVGTKHLIEFCHQMVHLEALVHVSTAYSNADIGVVNEDIYALPQDPDMIIEMVETTNDDIVNTLAPKFIGNRPNVYTYTKALAENMIAKKCVTFPVAIVRPSIVLASLKDPKEGWLDTFSGATPFVAAGGNGLFHELLGDGHMIADIVPVDMVANLMICAAWCAATHSSVSNIQVYNCCSGLQNPITWEEFIKMVVVALNKYPFEGAVVYSHIAIQENWIAYRLHRFLFEDLPLHVIDFISSMAGRKTNLVHLHSKVMKARESIEFFTTHQWKFKDDNVKYLNKLLEDKDRSTFPFDVRQINWTKYIESYIIGVRHFLLKNSPSSLPELRKRVRMFSCVSGILKCLLLLLLIRFMLFVIY